MHQISNIIVIISGYVLGYCGYVVLSCWVFGVCIGFRLVSIMLFVIDGIVII